MSRICRTCLEFIGLNASFYNLNAELNSESERIKLQLESVVPEMTLNIVKDTVICNNCKINLDIAYEFKQKCVRIEEQIYEYLFQAKLQTDSIDISSLIGKNIKVEPHSEDAQYEDFVYRSKNNNEQLLSMNTNQLDMHSTKSTTVCKYEDNSIEIEEYDLTNYDLKPVSRDLLGEFSARTINDIKCENVDSIIIDEPHCTNYEPPGNNKDITTKDKCSLSTTPDDNVTEEIYLIGKEHVSTTSANHAEQILSYQTSLANADEIRPNTPSKEDGNHNQLVRPCSVILNHIANILCESLKQTSKLIETRQQKNGNVTCSRNSSYIQTHRIDSKHKKYPSYKNFTCRRSSRLSEVTKAETKSKFMDVLHTPKKNHVNKYETCKTEPARNGISSPRKSLCTEDHLCNNSKKCFYTPKQKSDSKNQLINTRSYTDVKLFGCRFCNYKSSQSNNVQRHKLIHSGRKPYKCELCQFKTAWKQSLQTHLKCVH